MTDSEVLDDGLSRLGMDGDECLRDRLQRFADLIAAANPVYGLVDADRRRLITHHLLDSLAAVAALRELEPRATLLDVGSGAGLPGVPLALALAGTRVILVERSTRRAAFLNHVRRALAPVELTVVDRPLAEAALAPVDVVTWRAVAPLPRLLPGLLPLLHSRSTVALYQGTAETVHRELAAARQAAGARLRARVIPLAVPHLDGERHLILLRGLKA
ncbi:MAG: class I SAM-dependent methyltransferase [Spirochaetaceae bacterium]|nr:class I SAM-dependent methyltransferase [Spirochaetaceae bacterium]